MLLKEQESKVRYDSLFLGLKFGMYRADFFDYCREMNRNKIFMNGPMTATSSRSVLYSINGLKYEAKMFFYPVFEKQKIAKMEAHFEFEGWATWNKERYSTVLLPEVKQLVQDWYKGNDFVALEVDDGKEVFVKIDGNRQMLLYAYDNQTVDLIITDLNPK